MADVTGNIGDQQVELNNAATEATLRALLTNAKIDTAILKGFANKFDVKWEDFQEALDESAEAIDDNTKKQIEQAQALENSIEKWRKINTVVDQLNTSMHKLAAGTFKTSDLMTSLEALPGAFGAVARVLTPFVKMQEENFESYQKMSSAGITFAGSLIDMRQAAANSFLTLNEFTTLMKSNGPALAQFGGSVNDGALAFSRFSSSIMKSPLGTNLMALGFTTQEANQGMLTYLAASGARDAKEIESNSKLREGAGQYLEELDRLAEVTGKSREQQEDIMKKQQVDAQIQVTAARMLPEQRAAFEQNVKYMTMMYGDAGKDMALAQAQGRSVMTKEGAMLTAMAPGIQGAYKKMVDAGNEYGIGSQQYIDAQNQMTLQVKGGFDKVPTAALGLIKGLDQAQLTYAQVTKQGLDTKKALDERDIKIANDRADREKSQAKTMAETNSAFKELGAELLHGFSPVIEGLTWLGKQLAPLASGFAALLKHTPGLSTVIAVVISSMAALAAYNSAKLLKQKTGALLGGAGKLLGGSSGGGGGVGDVLGGVAKGGPGIGIVLEGLAHGLKAFAHPMVVLGAGAFGIALGLIIAAVGGGIAAAAYLIGSTLPTLAAGLKSFSDIDGGNLIKVAAGVGALGLALAGFGLAMAAGSAGAAFDRVLTFATGGGTGGIAGVVEEITKSLAGFDPGKLMGFASGLDNLSKAMVSYGNAVATIDIAKAERVKELMKGPTAAEQIANAGAKAFSAAASQITQAISGPATSGTEKQGQDIMSLNNTMKEILKYIKAIEDNTEVSARIAKPSWIPKGMA